MYGLLYLSTIIRIYLTIRYLHGAYVSYYFLKWILVTTHSNFVWVFSFLQKPNEQLEDKYQSFKIKDGYVFII
jgi:hypothetical protein